MSGNKKSDFAELASLCEVPDSGVSILNEDRHFSLPWHHIDRVQDGLAQICQSSVGRYWREFNCVRLGVKSAKIVGPGALVMGEHGCMHLQAQLQWIVFTPEIGAEYTGIGLLKQFNSDQFLLQSVKGEVVSSDDRVVVVKMYSFISLVAHCPKNCGDKPKVGDFATVRVQQIQTHKKLFSLQGTLLKHKRTKRSEKVAHGSKTDEGYSSFVNGHKILDPSHVFGPSTSKETVTVEQESDSTDSPESSRKKKHKKKKSKRSRADMEEDDINILEDSGVGQSMVEEKRSRSSKKKRKIKDET